MFRVGNDLREDYGPYIEDLATRNLLIYVIGLLTQGVGIYTRYNKISVFLLDIIIFPYTKG